MATQLTATLMETPDGDLVPLVALSLLTPQRKREREARGAGRKLAVRGHQRGHLQQGQHLVLPDHAAVEDDLDIAALRGPPGEWRRVG